MSARRITLKDIAAVLGVSVNTVSRALANKSDISLSMRNKVQKLAEEMGYTPNSLARSLVSGTSSMIGMVITNPSNPLYSEMIVGASATAHENGLAIILAVSGEDETTERRAIESLIRSAVDGIVGVPVQTASDHWERLANLGIPLTFVNRDLEHLGFRTDFVGVDHGGGTAAQVSHVLAQGATRIWAFDEDLENSTVQRRLSAYREAAIPEENLRIIRVPSRRHKSLVMSWEAEESYALATQMAAETADLPDAVVCANDYFAIGVIRALSERGLRVPDDVLVIGSGNQPYAGFTSPSLSSMALPGRDLGSAAVQMVIDRCTSPDVPFRSRVLETTLIARDSTIRTRSRPAS